MYILRRNLDESCENKVPVCEKIKSILDNVANMMTRTIMANDCIAAYLVSNSMDENFVFMAQTLIMNSNDPFFVNDKMIERWSYQDEDNLPEFDSWKAKNRLNNELKNSVKSKPTKRL